MRALHVWHLIAAVPAAVMEQSQFDRKKQMKQTHHKQPQKQLKNHFNLIIHRKQPQVHLVQRGICGPTVCKSGSVRATSIAFGLGIMNAAHATPAVEEGSVVDRRLGQHTFALQRIPCLLNGPK